MSLPRPDVCECFGGNCWRRFCPLNKKRKKEREARETAAETPKPVEDQ